MIRILHTRSRVNLADSFRSFAGEFDDVSIDIHVGDLNEALLYFNLSIKAKSYDVVISRAGPRGSYGKNTNLPVIEVEVSLLDMHSAIKQAEQMGRSYVIVAFSNITATAKALASISQMDIAIRDIDSADDARALLAPLASADGSPLILGDNVTVNIASELGLDSLRKLPAGKACSKPSAWPGTWPASSRMRQEKTLFASRRWTRPPAP